MLENSIQNSTGIALAELMESPVKTLAYSKETQRVKIKDKMYVVVDGICNPEVDDVLGETSKRKIVSFSCDQDGKNVAALSFLQNRGYFFHVEFDPCHRYDEIACARAKERLYLTTW